MFRRKHGNGKRPTIAIEPQSLADGVARRTVKALCCYLGIPYDVFLGDRIIVGHAPGDERRYSQISMQPPNWYEGDPSRQPITRSELDVLTQQIRALCQFLRVEFVDRGTNLEVRKTDTIRPC